MDSRIPLAVNVYFQATVLIATFKFHIVMELYYYTHRSETSQSSTYPWQAKHNF